MPAVDVTIGPMRRDQVDAAARVLLRGFDDVADRHGFPRDLPGFEAAREIVRSKGVHPRTFVAVATLDDRVVGLIFMLRCDGIGGVGPVTVDPRYQGSGIGRLLVEAAIENGADLDGLRLTQDAYNIISLSLYARLGFEVKEPLVEVTGQPSSPPPPGYELRPLTLDDLAACRALYHSVHGVDREHEIRDAIRNAAPQILRREGRVVAYASRLPLVFDAHGVAESDEDMRALILRAHARFGGAVSLVVPTRQASFFRWCLGQGLRVTKPMNLLARGAYHDPRGAWFPSVLY